MWAPGGVAGASTLSRNRPGSALRDAATGGLRKVWKFVRIE